MALGRGVEAHILNDGMKLNAIVGKLIHEKKAVEKAARKARNVVEHEPIALDGPINHAPKFGLAEASISRTDLVNYLESAILELGLGTNPIPDGLFLNIKADVADRAVGLLLGRDSAIDVNGNHFCVVVVFVTESGVKIKNQFFGAGDLAFPRNPLAKKLIKKLK